jgi:hypothetical protein
MSDGISRWIRLGSWVRAHINKLKAGLANKTKVPAFQGTRMCSLYLKPNK